MMPWLIRDVSRGFDISIAKAAFDEKPVVARLLQLYLHECSAGDGSIIDEDGLFVYPWFDSYWTSPDRHPYLFRVDGRLAGFAFVRQREATEIGEWRWQIAEFFVLRGERKKKVGLAAALALLRSRGGIWDFSYEVSNQPARSFWGHVASVVGGSSPITTATGREHYRLDVTPELG